MQVLFEEESCMLKLLVSGATGFIGLNFVRKYHNKYNLYCLVRIQSDCRCLDDYACHVIKFANLDDIYDIVAEVHPDAVLHFAGVFFGKT